MKALGLREAMDVFMVMYRPYSDVSTCASGSGFFAFLRQLVEIVFEAHSIPTR